MKILFLNPPFLPKYSRSSRSPAVTKSGTIYYPLWLAHAAGLLENRGHETMLIDFPAECKSLEDYKRRIIEFDPEMVVCDTSTPSIVSDIQASEYVRSWFANAPIFVLVGTHASALAIETLKSSRTIDVVARGEYDWTLCELAEKKRSFAGIRGIVYRQNDEIIESPERPYAENLDELPYVSSVYKKHLNINNYFYAHCQNPVISIFAGRGCPNRCNYCVYPQVMFGRAYRHRSVDHFVGEIEYIGREFPEVREILIDDDNFTADQEFVKDICEEIIRRNIKVAWTCEARVNLKYDVMVKMKQAGCRLLVAGFESGDQRVLDNVNKGITLQQSREFALNAKRAGIRVHGCFMAGNRGDTQYTLSKTLSFALGLALDTAQFFPLMAYPGTEAYDWANRNDYIKADSFRQWLTEEGMHNCVIDTEDLSAKQLVEFCDRARRRFYLRPKYIFYKLLDVIRNPHEIKRTAKAARRLAGHLFRAHR
jgi:anaerobic magnesium-protoporphyrin IX monomethyl ester cyclase